MSPGSLRGRFCISWRTPASSAGWRGGFESDDGSGGKEKTMSLSANFVMITYALLSVVLFFYSSAADAAAPAHRLYLAT
jgi:hypothetical protein